MPPAENIELNSLWTIGHSNRAAEEFLQLLGSENIAAVADVRRFPGSRRSPHFGSEALSAALRKTGVEYRHFAELGGRRTARAEESPNSAWRVEAFRAYADYTLTGEFAEALAALTEYALRQRTAIMCAEALPWQCHRRLIADQFVVRRWQVYDIVGLGQVRPHALPEFAKVVDGRLTYPGATLFD